MSTHLPSVVSCDRAGGDLPGEPRGGGVTPGVEEMHLVYATSGCDAWASLPLLAERAAAGSLTVSWVDPGEFTNEEKELL